MMGSKKPGQAPATPAVLVRLSEADYLAVASAAERDGASLSGFVRTLLRRHIESMAA